MWQHSCWLVSVRGVPTPRDLPIQLENQNTYLKYIKMPCGYNEYKWLVHTGHAMKAKRKKVISKDWANRKGLIKETGPKEGIKLIGASKELGCYKPGEPLEQNYGWRTKKRTNCLSLLHVGNQWRGWKTKGHIGKVTECQVKELGLYPLDTCSIKQSLVRCGCWALEFG